MLAKRTFQISGCFGILELIPLLFMNKTTAALTQPALYYGFLGVTLAWQFVFLLIATDPPRYRQMMVPSMIEKGSYLLAVGYAFVILKPPPSTLVFAAIDTVWLLLFVAAYMKTPKTQTMTAQ